MKFQLFTQVALKEDMPTLRLKQGSIGTICRVLPHAKRTRKRL